MMDKDILPRIAVLSSSVANKIAAGEVIERPSSVLRELIDNAIDAGASRISVQLEEGGMKEIRVNDNGCGMSAAELKLCYLRHATSKIREIDDLQKITSLGFRGEALSSIAACSRLHMRSMVQAAAHAWQLILEGDSQAQLQKTQGTQGTVVSVRDLFFYLPARRHFLKRAATEASYCQKVFFEKALGFPEISFSFQHNDKTSLHLPASTLLQRLGQIYHEIPIESLSLLEGETQHFKLKIFAAAPDMQWRNRRFIQIFANRRNLEDTPLQQAIRLSYDGFVHQGSQPICFAFFTLAPSRFDFNIHPTKKEARFLDLNSMQSLIRQLLRNFLHQRSESGQNAILPQAFLQNQERKVKQFASSPFSNAPKTQQNAEPTPLSGTTINKIFSTAKPIVPPSVSQAEMTTIEFEEQIAFRYIGQLMELFLLFEYEDTLYILDQHAAHERLLYEHFSQDQLPNQKLLIPKLLKEAETNSLKERHSLFMRLGLELEEREGQWFVKALPLQLDSVDEELEELICNGAYTDEDLQRHIFARISCRAAIKAGENLEPVAAVALIEEVINKQLLNCPHGRPVATSLSRKTLFEMLKRC